MGRLQGKIRGTWVLGACVDFLNPCSLWNWGSYQVFRVIFEFSRDHFRWWLYGKVWSSLGCMPNVPLAPIIGSWLVELGTLSLYSWGWGQNSQCSCLKKPLACIVGAKAKPYWMRSPPGWSPVWTTGVCTQQEGLFPLVKTTYLSLTKMTSHPWGNSGESVPKMSTWLGNFAKNFFHLIPTVDTGRF